MSDSGELLTNHFATEADVWSVERGFCNCFQFQDWACLKPRELLLHTGDQDPQAKGWLLLQELVKKAAAEGWEEFTPSHFIEPAEWARIVTLPSSIGKLKSVKRLRLYGSSLTRIPPEIGQMENLEIFEPYTSYNLHWFPYEITRCKKLKDSTISTRALYGNYKYRSPFPRLPQVAPQLVPKSCSVCNETLGDEIHQAWISLRVATDVVPLLVNACSPRCLNRLPSPAKGYVSEYHQGGLDLVQPPSDRWTTPETLLEYLEKGLYDVNDAARDAVFFEHTDLLKQLLLQGADPNETFLQACRFGKLLLAELIWRNGPDINYQDHEGETPLIASTINGHLEVAKFLLDRGADRSLRDLDGADALTYAARGPYTEWSEGGPPEVLALFKQLEKLLTA